VRTSIRLTLYAEAVLATFLVAYGVGALAGEPVATPAPAAHGGEHGGDHSPDGGERAGVASGLQVAEAGYRLSSVTAPGAVGQAGELRLTVTGTDGAPLRDYDVVHDKQLHLVVVRRDTTQFRHVHPELGPDGTWTIPWTWSQAGSYRVFADFDPAGAQGQLTLGTDVQVAGDLAPQPLPPTTRTTQVDGYAVTLDGDLTAGAEQSLTFTVTRDGEPVTDLEPYLGAYGHLVALRAGDLAYLHVHPEADTGSGPQVRFAASAPSPATYRLFLDFQHAGQVRTAEFTLDTAGPGPGPALPAPAPAPHGEEDGHGDTHG
jgi:hypothetical protein